MEGDIHLKRRRRYSLAEKQKLLTDFDEDVGEDEQVTFASFAREHRLPYQTFRGWILERDTVFGNG